jgi:hypothetical protein
MTKDETISTRVQRIRDELKLRTHLAALDARDAWDRAHLERVGDEIVGLRDEARLQAHLGAMNARAAWARLDDEIRTLAGKTGAAADDATAAIARALGEIVDGIDAESARAEAAETETAR